MARPSRFISIAVLGLGIAALAMGGVLVAEGLSKANYIKEQMRAEQVTLAALGVEGSRLQWRRRCKSGHRIGVAPVPCHGESG